MGLIFALGTFSMSKYKNSIAELGSVSPLLTSTRAAGAGLGGYLHPFTSLLPSDNLGNFQTIHSSSSSSQQHTSSVN